jgi:hypothetical protein
VPAIRHSRFSSLAVLLGVAAAITISAGVSGGSTAALATNSSGESVMGVVGDMACDPSDPDYNGGAGTSDHCGERRTSDAMVQDTSIDAVLGLGDFQYQCGDPSDYVTSYDPTWGRFDPIMNPVAGNHEYISSSGCPAGNTTAQSYFSHFGARAAPATNGHYSFNRGSWHMIALNANCSNTDVGGCSATSPQTQWLENDLANVDESTQPCIAAFWHQPFYTGANTGKNANYQAWWDALYAAGADVVLNGHVHVYERFPPLDPSGAADPAHGITEYIVGTGGEDLVGKGAASPQPDAFIEAFGYMRMTLHAAGWTTEFVDASGNTHDPSTGTCHGTAPPTDTTAPTTTITCNGSPCSASAYSATVNIALTASDAGGSGVNTTLYTTDGSDPASSTTAVTYTSPFPVSQTTTVRYASSDNAGNQEPTRSETIQITTRPADTTPPTTTISCSGSPCLTGWYKQPSVDVALAAADTGGSGLKSTRYTTNGTSPLTSPSALTYTGPFTVSSTATIKFASTDNAGNKEAVHTQKIKIDAAPPSVAITSPANGSSFKRGTAVTLNATATDAGTNSGAASGIARVIFYLDGTIKLGTDTSAPYTAKLTTTGRSLGSHTLTAVASDVATNTTTSAPITVNLTP